MDLHSMLSMGWNILRARPDLLVSIVVFVLVAGFDSFEQAKAQREGENWQSAILRILARFANILILANIGDGLIATTGSIFKPEAALVLVLAAGFYYATVCLTAELKVKDRSFFIGWSLGIMRFLCKSASVCCLAAAGVITGLDFAKLGLSFFDL